MFYSGALCLALTFSAEANKSLSASANRGCLPGGECVCMCCLVSARKKGLRVVGEGTTVGEVDMTEENL